MTKVTSRTLRHYDAIGLLPPAWTEAGGRRMYTEDELVRLQQILVLRELGVSLDDVAEVLGGGTPTVEVLRRHKRWLNEEQRRLKRLSQSVARTIEHLKKGTQMDTKTMFDGFEHNPYEEEARQRWGNDVVDASKQRMQSLDQDEAELARTGFTQVHEQLAPLMAEGVPVEDPRVQEVIDLHHRVLNLFWTPSREAYIGLGQMYVDDERFHEAAGGGNPELVAYLRDGMTVYANERLAE